MQVEGSIPSVLTMVSTTYERARNPGPAIVAYRLRFGTVAAEVARRRSGKRPPKTAQSKKQKIVGLNLKNVI